MAATGSAGDDRGDWQETLVDTIGINPPQASAVETTWPSQDALVKAMTNDASLTDASGVGSRTATRLWDWFGETYPERYRQRREESNDYCMAYTTDHGLDADSLDPEKFYWAFICPRCGETNPLVGDPDGFAGRPFRCESCLWVPLLDAEAVREFRDEHYDDAEGE